MSWYVSQDGEQLWIARNETVYTLVECDEKKLPVEDLTYLTVSSRKTVYHEHIVDEDLLADGKSRVPRRKRENQSGRQRGFILRAEVEEAPMQRVVPCFKAATQKLVDDGEVSRVDADDAVNTKRKKNKGEKRVDLNLGVNECRVETTARINHFAHGVGFRVEVAQGSITQRIHIYTHRRQIPYQEWHEVLTEALESTNSYVMLARRTQNEEANGATDGQDKSEAKDGLVPVAKSKKDKALQEDEAWLQRMMGMASEKEDDDASDQDSDPTSVQSGRRSASVPPATAPVAQPAARSASPTARSSAGQRPAARALPPRELLSAESLRSADRLSSERGVRERDTRDWRFVRDPPRHVGYTTDWTNSEPPAQEAQEMRERRRDNPGGGNRSRWSESHERPSRDEEWKSRGPSRRSGFGGPRNRAPAADARPAGANEWDSRPRDPTNPWDTTQSYRAAPRGRQQTAAAQHRPQQPQQPQPPQQPQWQPQAHAPKERANKAWQEEESRTSKSVRDQAAKCFDCGRGKPLKLFIDDDDGNPYCHACWVEFYGLKPPNK